MCIDEFQIFPIGDQLISWNQAVLNRVAFLSPTAQLIEAETLAKDYLSSWSAKYGLVFIDMDMIIELIVPKIDIYNYYLNPKSCFSEIENSALRQFLSAYFHVPDLEGDMWRNELDYLRGFFNKYVLYYSYSSAQKILDDNCSRISDIKRVLEFYWRHSRSYCWPIFFVYDMNDFKKEYSNQSVFVSGWQR